MSSTLKVQNFYYTNVTSESIPSSGAFTFNVAVAPTYTNWFLVISAENTIQREIVYFHSVSGNVISVRAENRALGGTTAKEHIQGESITMRDVAEIFNFYSDAVSTCFFTEKTGWLNVKVWGWLVYYNTVLTTVADTNLTLTDNAINYIKYSYTTNVISADTINVGNIKAIVTVVSGVIVSIVYNTAKETYTDFTVSLNTALPSQPGNAWKFLQTDWTNATWQPQADTPDANITVKWILEIATTAESKSATDTGWTGASLSVLPSDIAKNIQSWSFVYWTDVGWDDTYVVALTPILTAYTTGQTLTMKVSTANTGACTVDFWPWAKSIKMPNGTDPSNGMVTWVVNLMYDGTNFILQNQNWLIKNGVLTGVSIYHWVGAPGTGYSASSWLITSPTICIVSMYSLNWTWWVEKSTDGSTWTALYSNLLGDWSTITFTFVLSEWFHYRCWAWPTSGWSAGVNSSLTYTL